ncbi:hypothetical protein FJZ31_37140 [Candidatus Poribacteria bacterium]|nr:hypothetical protein [Candidatus Poribacteria bacterium]
MERSSIKLLKKRGNTNIPIAQVLGRDMKTVKRALIEPADKEYYQPKRGSLVDSYEESIRQRLPLDSESRMELLLSGQPVQAQLDRDFAV